jgi:hypothetical protein
MFTLGMIIAPDGEAYGINRKKRARKWAPALLCMEEAR